MSTGFVGGAGAYHLGHEGAGLRPAACTTGTADSTGIEGYVGGALKQSLTYAVDLAKKTVTIGSNLFYSVYVELGTGIFAEKGNGRKTPWVWKDFNGKWHFTRGMDPRPFLRPAVEDHVDELRQIAVEEGNKEV